MKGLISVCLLLVVMFTTSTNSHSGDISFGGSAITVSVVAQTPGGAPLIVPGVIGVLGGGSALVGVNATISVSFSGGFIVVMISFDNGTYCNYMYFQ